jgi:peptidoglycan hydrolase CwlO-like protein
MVKEPDEYTDMGAEFRRLDQNIEGLLNKFQKQSKMLVRVDQHEEHLEQLFTEVAELRERLDALDPDQ